MIKYFIIFLSIIYNSFALKINVITVENNKGLHIQKDILLEDLRDLGHDAQFVDIHSTPRIADINIFIELLNESSFNCAEKNYYIPNPECFVYDISLLEKIDKILCPTHNTKNIFDKFYPEKTYFLSFRSIDKYDSCIQKSAQTLLHFCGSSPYKGTKELIRYWNRGLPLNIDIFNHGQFPSQSTKNMNVYDVVLSKEELNHKINSHLIHLCPSLAEGFGFYLVEAMSAGAVIITTNAPPMNEFIKDERFLINFSHSEKCLLGTLYYFSKDDFYRIMLNLKKMSFFELMEVGRKNREAYLDLSKNFRTNLKVLLNNY